MKDEAWVERCFEVIRHSCCDGSAQKNKRESFALDETPKDAFVPRAVPSKVYSGDPSLVAKDCHIIYIYNANRLT
jgi:hypothetical protein